MSNLAYPFLSFSCPSSHPPPPSLPPLTTPSSSRRRCLNSPIPQRTKLPTNQCLNSLPPSHPSVALVQLPVPWQNPNAPYLVESDARSRKKRALMKGAEKVVRARRTREARWKKVERTVWAWTMVAEDWAEGKRRRRQRSGQGKGESEGQTRRGGRYEAETRSARSPSVRSWWLRVDPRPVLVTHACICEW